MTAVADRDTGDNTCGQVVDHVHWLLAGKKNPPPRIARLSAEERDVLWGQLNQVANRHRRHGLIQSLVTAVRARKRTNRTMDVDRQSESGD